MFHSISTEFMSRKGSYTDDQLRYWFDLFNNFFVKTLENQTNKNFSVFVEIQDEMPDDRLKFMFERCKQLNWKIGRRHELIKYIKSKWHDNDFIISSRLDCDDLIHAECVSDIQNFAHTITHPIVYGYDNCLLLDGTTNKYYRVPCRFQRSQMQSIIYNTSISSSNKFFLPHNWDNSCPLDSIPEKDVTLFTDHTKDAAVWHRHPKATLWNRFTPDNSQLASIHPKAILTRFGTVPYDSTLG